MHDANLLLIIKPNPLVVQINVKRSDDRECMLAAANDGSSLAAPAGLDNLHHLSLLRQSLSPQPS